MRSSGCGDRDDFTLQGPSISFGIQLGRKVWGNICTAALPVLQQARHCSPPPSCQAFLQLLGTALLSCLPLRDMTLILQATQKIQKAINYFKGPGWERRKSSPPATLIDLWQLCYEALGDLYNDTNSMLKPWVKPWVKTQQNKTRWFNNRASS